MGSAYPRQQVAPLSAGTCLGEGQTFDIDFLSLMWQQILPGPGLIRWLNSLRTWISARPEMRYTMDEVWL